MKKIIKFCLFLIRHYNICSLKLIQKILFFIKVWEKKNKIKNSPIFCKKDVFRAWSTGPVNKESYYILFRYFYAPDKYKITEKMDKYKISKDLENKYSKYLDLCDFLILLSNESGVKLQYVSERNLAYQKARKKLEWFEPCDKIINEKSKLFTMFQHDKDLDNLYKYHNIYEQIF